MCKIVAKLSIFSIPAKKKSKFLSKNIYNELFPVVIVFLGRLELTE